MELTYHCKVERANRVQQIINKVGIGQVVKERYRLGHNVSDGAWLCVTDTGVTLIKDELKTKVITMYITTYRELVYIYGGEKRVPKYLHKKVDQNQSWFTKDGKTIWR